MVTFFFVILAAEDGEPAELLRLLRCLRTGDEKRGVVFCLEDERVFILGGFLAQPSLDGDSVEEDEFIDSGGDDGSGGGTCCFGDFDLDLR